MQRHSFVPFRPYYFHQNRSRPIGFFAHGLGFITTLCETSGSDLAKLLDHKRQTKTVQQYFADTHDMNSRW